MVLNAVQELVGQIQQNTQSHAHARGMLEQLSVNQVSQLKTIDELRQDSLQVLRNVLKSSELQMQMLDKVEMQRQLLQNSLQQHAQLNQVLVDTQAGWLLQFETHQQLISSASQATHTVVIQERQAWLDQLKTWTESHFQQQSLLNGMVDRFEDIFQSIGQQSRQAELFREQLRNDQSSLLQLLQTMTQVGQQISQHSKDDVASRAELLHQMKLSQTEHQERYEQLVHLLTSSMNSGSLTVAPKNAD